MNLSKFFISWKTTTEVLKKIVESGKISRISRHAIHMQADKELA